MAIDWFEALGAKKPQEGGQDGGDTSVTDPAKEQELAEPAADEGGQLENEPIEGAEEEEAAKEQELAEPANELGKKPQTRKEREKFAQGRRRSEMLAELESFKTDIRSEMKTALAQQKDSFIAGLGLVNPYTGQRISTQAEYDAMNAEKLRRDADEQLQGAGLSRELFDKLIENHPDVVAARKASAEAETAKVSATEVTTSERAKAQLEEIQALDPSVKSLSDLLDLPSYPQIKAILQSQRDGETAISIADAFYLANRKEIETRRQAAAKQEAINLAKGKDHMTTVEPHSQKGAITVPAGVAAQYRQFFPGITDAEIQKKYEAVNGRK